MIIKIIFIFFLLISFISNNSISLIKFNNNNRLKLNLNLTKTKKNFTRIFEINL